MKSIIRFDVDYKIKFLIILVGILVIFFSASASASQQKLEHSDILETLTILKKSNKSDIVNDILKLEQAKRHAISQQEPQKIYQALTSFNDYLFDNRSSLTDRDLLTHYKNNTVTLNGIFLNQNLLAVHKQTAIDTLQFDRMSFAKSYFENYFFKLRDLKVGFSGSNTKTGVTGLSVKSNDFGLLFNTDPIAAVTFMQDKKLFDKFCHYKKNTYDWMKSNGVSSLFKKLQIGYLHLCYEQTGNDKYQQYVLEETLENLKNPDTDASTKAREYVRSQKSLWKAKMFGVKNWTRWQYLKVRDQKWGLLKDFTDNNRFQSNSMEVFNQVRNYESRLFAGLSRKNIDRLSDEQSLVLESYFTNNIQSFERHLSNQLYMGGNVIEFERLNQVRAYLDYLKFLLLVDDFEKFERNFLQAIDKFIELVDFHVLASSDEVFDFINPIANQLIQLYTNKALQNSGEKESLNSLSRLISGVKNAEQNLDAILYRNVHLHGGAEDKSDLKAVFQIDKRLAVDNVYTRETMVQNWLLPLQLKQGLKKKLLKKFAGHIRKDLKSNIIEYLQAKSPIRIPEGTVHLNYYRLDEDSQLYLLAHYPDGNIDLHRIVTQKPLSSLLDLKPFLSTQNLATFSSILLPEEVNLDGAKRISISPLPMLSSFPFEALNYKNKFLVENFDVYYNPSSTFSDHSLQLTNQDSVSIFSNPVYKPFDLSEGLNVNTASRSISRSQRNEYSFSPLFETKLEGEIIASLLSKKTSKILSFDNRAASEQNLLSLKSPKLLHIASHGFSIDLKKEVESKPHNIANSKSYYVIESPLSISGLALSFADLNKHTTDSENDGVIDYYELGAMDLSDTDLIVLSSCETATGSAQDGYIFSGLRKALALSGVAHSVTTSQKIPSDDTVEFMHMFYHKLLDHSYISALSEAKREMIKNNKSMEAWAPFLLSVN